MEPQQNQEDDARPDLEKIFTENKDPNLYPPPASATGLPPRPPGPRCTVCNHPARDRIDALLVAGGRTYNDLAREFEIDDSAIHRHSQTHLPARLLRNREELQTRADAAFVKLAVTQSVNRLRRIQGRMDLLEQVRLDRAGAADPGVPGDRTGLIVKQVRSIRTGQESWREVVDAHVDTGLLAEERMLERAAAVETGEWLAQTGKGAFGAGEGGRGPLVVVLATGLQPIPGPAGPEAARHRISDARRQRTATAAEVEGAQAGGVAPPPSRLDNLDLEQTPEWVDPGPDTLEGALPGAVQGDRP